MQAHKFHYAWLIMIACCAISSCAGIIMTAASNLFLPVSIELGVGIGKVTFYVTILSLTMAFLFPTAGKFLNKNLKLTLLFGGICQYIALGCMSFYNNIYLFYISGFFIGVGMSITLYMAIPMLLNMWFVKKIGLAMGIAMACNGVSGAIFSQVIGYSLPLIGWRGCYILLAICGLIIYVPAILFLVKTPQQKKLLPYGADNDFLTPDAVSTQNEQSNITIGQLIKQPAFLCMMLFGIVLAAAQSEIPHIATASSAHFGYNVQIAATMVSLNCIGLLIGNVSIGAINDKLGEKITVIFGISLVVLSQIMLIIGHASIVLVFAGVFIFGFSMSTYNVIAPLMTSTIFGTKNYNTIWAFICSAASIAGAIAPPVFGYTFDQSGSYTIMFFLVIALAVIGLFSGLIALKNKAH